MSKSNVVRAIVGTIFFGIFALAIYVSEKESQKLAGEKSANRQSEIINSNLELEQNGFGQDNGDSEIPTVVPTRMTIPTTQSTPTTKPNPATLPALVTDKSLATWQYPGSETANNSGSSAMYVTTAPFDQVIEWYKAKIKDMPVKTSIVNTFNGKKTADFSATSGSVDIKISVEQKDDSVQITIY